MGERIEPSRYSYWSKRRIESIAEDEGISIDPHWNLKIAGKLPLIPISLETERPVRTLRRNDIASRIERAIGDHAVEDFVTPPPVRYAKGVGRIEYSHFISGDRGRVVLHTSTDASDGTHVDVCLFGSRHNVADFLGPDDRQVDGWTSSAWQSVREWLASECTVNDSQWDDPESISVEALKIATRQGTNKHLQDNPDQPWQRGWTFADATDAEWYAEIFSDVVLDKDRWDFRDDERIDRILVGAPLWIRSPRSGVRRYKNFRRSLSRDDFHRRG